MRNLLLGLSASLISLPSWADDITTPLNVTAATIYSQGARVTYHAAVDLPAGQHRVVLPYDVKGYNFTPPQLMVSDGVRIGAINYLSDVAYDQDALLSPAQIKAKAAVGAARDAIAAKQTEVRTANLQLAALDTQAGFLKSVSGGELANADPAQIQALAQMVRSESEAAIAQRLELEQQSRDLNNVLRDLNDELAEAERLFERLSPPKGQGGMMAITVEVAAPVTARIEVVQIVENAGWSVDYDLHLKYGNDPSLMVERKVVVEQTTGQAWADIDLVLSTANPFAQSSPSTSYQNLVRIYENAPMQKITTGARMATSSVMMDESVMVEEAVMEAAAQFDGLSLSYVYPRKVTLGNNESVQLVLDNFALPVDISLLAIPRRDVTAFVMAAITNNTDEPLLPGMASYYRDGAFIGRDTFDLVPAGAEADLSFGAMEGVRLTYTALRQETGDTGIITTSNTRMDMAEFTVENLTNQPQKVRALFSLPSSQQEDLVISTRIRPNPNETDVDKVRGVAAWDMTIPAGETQKVQLTTELSWPKGYELNWAQ